MRSNKNIKQIVCLTAAETDYLTVQNISDVHVMVVNPRNQKRNTPR